jgi:hypothetical protein
MNKDISMTYRLNDVQICNLCSCQLHNMKSQQISCCKQVNKNLRV